MLSGREEVLSDDLTAVGLIVSGENLQFGKNGIRMIETKPLNTTNAQFIQFHVVYQGQNKNMANFVVLQSSGNNGISWKTLHLIKPTGGTSKFIHISLPESARRNMVVFRLWQTGINAGK